VGVAWVFTGGVLAFLSGGDQPVAAGTEGRGSQPYLGPRGAGRCPGDKMIDCCDVRSHVVSECVEGGWLMPGT
jgi:hypothetical protein